MQKEKAMKLEKLKGNFSRPSRVTLVPIVTLIKILSLQITKKPVLSLKRVGFSGAEGALFDPVTCAAGLLGDQYLPKRKVVMSIKDFGVGDGTASTTEAFRIKEAHLSFLVKDQSMQRVIKEAESAE
ncbi:hypothetical protein AB3S75_002836 [Citrus x aurantiifolia]